jgi:hypothetical protein
VIDGRPREAAADEHIVGVSVATRVAPGVIDKRGTVSRQLGFGGGGREAASDEVKDG